MTLDDLLSIVDIEPRPYQKRVIEKTVNHFITDNLPSVLIESPTGSGKTVMALAIIKLLQETLGVSVGWVAMRRYLLEQTEQANIDKGFNNKIEYISMFDKNPPMVDMLIVDEAQHDSTDSCAHIHNTIKPRFILGLTATPFRADRVKLFFQKIVKDAGIRVLIKEGWLSKFDHYSLENWKVENVVSHYLKEPARWGKSVMFFHTVNQCMEAKERLETEGFQSEVVTGSSDKHTQIDRFAHDDVKILINCMVLTEGFDCPSLQTVFCRDSGKGVTMQMCGRAFRKWPGITRKNVVQSKNSKWPFVKTADPEMQYLWQNNSWRGLKLNEEIGLMQRNILWKLAHTSVKIPDILTKKKTPARRNFGR